MMCTDDSNKTMSKENITFRIDSSKKAALDQIAAEINRDRSYILDIAVAAYLEMYQWQIEEIQKGIAGANAGDFASDEGVKATFARLTHAVKWLRRALRNLEQAHSYIFKDNPTQVCLLDPKCCKSYWKIILLWGDLDV